MKGHLPKLRNLALASDDATEGKKHLSFNQIQIEKRKKEEHLWDANDHQFIGIFNITNRSYFVELNVYGRAVKDCFSFVMPETTFLTNIWTIFGRLLGIKVVENRHVKLASRLR